MSRVGKLLVSHPHIPREEWFYKTVIYIYQDDPKKGTLGLTVNVPTNMTIKKVCYDKGILFPDSTKLLHKGGPVNGTAVIMLHSNEWTASNTTAGGDAYSLTSDNMMFEKISMDDQPAYWRMCLGVCAWQPGQLDMELKGQFPYSASNSWLTCDANDDILFNYDGEEQWTQALELSSKQMINSFF